MTIDYEKMAEEWLVERDGYIKWLEDNTTYKPYDGTFDGLAGLLERVASEAMAQQRVKDIRIANDYRHSFPTGDEPGRSIDYIVADIKAQGEA